uniref:Uncharacterized protein n=1 Tax=Anopheles quadriannulatus TaxID=34691 RepID=A0A182XU12_ANOQN
MHEIEVKVAAVAQIKNKHVKR